MFLVHIPHLFGSCSDVLFINIETNQIGIYNVKGLTEK